MNVTNFHHSQHNPAQKDEDIYGLAVIQKKLEQLSALRKNPDPKSSNAENLDPRAMRDIENLERETFTEPRKLYDPETVGHRIRDMETPESDGSGSQRMGEIQFSALIPEDDCCVECVTSSKMVWQCK